MNELTCVADPAERVGASSNWVLLELKVQGKSPEWQEIWGGDSQVMDGLWCTGKGLDFAQKAAGSPAAVKHDQI